MARETEYWDPRIETMPLEKLKGIQLKKIKELLNHAYLNSPFYRRRFDEAGIKPEDIKTLGDFRKKVPVFRADDLRVEAERLKDPYAGMLTVPLGRVELIFSSTGTTGIPKFTALTSDEGEELAEALVRCSWMVNRRPGTGIMGTSEPLAIMPFWHWYSSALGKAHGKLLGVKSIRDSILGTAIGVSFFDDAISRVPAHTAAIVADYLSAITGECAKRGVNAKGSIKVDCLWQAGDVMTPLQRKIYLESLGVKELYDGYACGEPFYWASECHVHNGGHLSADYYYVELIDPDTGEPLPPGKPGDVRGEITVTNLFMKAVPWIRYATEDFGWWTEERCECGRTHPRIRIMDRTLFRVKVKDKTLMPYDVRLVMERHPETAEANFNIIKYAQVMDTLRLRATYNPALTKDPDELRGRLVKDFKKGLGVDSEIEWVSYEELAKILHKLVRVVDSTKG